MVEFTTEQGTAISRYLLKRQNGGTGIGGSEMSTSRSSNAKELPKGANLALFAPNDTERAVKAPSMTDDDRPEHNKQPCEAQRPTTRPPNKFDGQSVASLPSQESRNRTSRQLSLHYSENVYLPPSRSTTPTSSPRQGDGPPDSNNINATTVTSTRRICTGEDGGYVGCFSFLRREPGPNKESIEEAQRCAMRHITTSRSGDTNLPRTQLPGLVEDNKSADESLMTPIATAECEHGGLRQQVSALSLELTSEEPSRCSKNKTLGDRRFAEHSNEATTYPYNTVSNLPMQKPYEMRYGAVQPRYFLTNETAIDPWTPPSDSSHQNSVRRSATISYGSPNDPSRSNSTLYIGQSPIRKPLIDLTPEYRPPPQHRQKGHGYQPEQFDSEKLIDFATSPRNVLSIPPKTQWRASADLVERGR